MRTNADVQAVGSADLYAGLVRRLAALARTLATACGVGHGNQSAGCMIAARISGQRYALPLYTDPLQYLSKRLSPHQKPIGLEQSW